MPEQQPAGWYYAEGDPPGTQRYWDGELWQGNPQPVQQAPAAPSSYSGGGYTGGPANYRESSQATTALVLSIVGLVICGLLGPVAWSMANKELEGIEAGRRDPSKQGTAKAAKVIGIIVTVLLLLSFLVLAVLLFAGA